MGTFLNAVKNLINSLTAKTSSTASTADMVQLHDANGNPNGKISLADLASVLGVLIPNISLTAATAEMNFDNIYSGAYQVAGTISVSGLPKTGSCFVFCPFYRALTFWKFQMAIYTTTGEIYWRTGYSSGYAGSWYKLTGTAV